MAKKRKRLIKKLRVHEVSLAFNPANGTEFILKKDQGGSEMDKLTQLVAWLATKADVPEVVKEELKDFVPKSAPKDIEKVLKEVGIEVKPEVVEKVVEKKAEKVKVDGKDVRVDKLLKDFETYRGQVEVLKKELQKMEHEVLRKEVEMRVDKETADEILEKYYGKLDKDEIIELADKFSGLAKLAKDMKGTSGEPPEDALISKQIEERVEKIMKDRGVSRSDAIVILADENPDMVPHWK